MRQLVATVFADMVGYTALMQENEQLALEKRRRLKEAIDASIQKFNGRILQHFGDGLLIIFNSAIDAVRSSIEVQLSMLHAPKVDLRMGIHSGDVVLDEEGIFGDSVNIASRIESIAVPGSVFISEKVFDEVKNQEGIQVLEMGYFEFKNVKIPIRVYALSNHGLVVPARSRLQGKTKPSFNRLAVLPFVNMSADAENEYFSDGITEELLNALTKVEGLQVTSRTSAFVFKNRQEDIRDIAAKLNVDKVLEGSVRKFGTRVRIAAQLINAIDGYHLWSETYDRDLDDIFKIQDEISGIIAQKLRENLHASALTGNYVKAPTANIEAYTLYLKGLHFRNKVTPADARKAITYFEEAIGLEPDYAQAYAMAAGQYSYLGATGQMSPAKAFELVHRYADKALLIDASVAEGHVAKASAYLFHEWNWRKAYNELQKAIQLNPAAASTYQMLGFYYILMGQKDEAVKIMEEAATQDPLSPHIIQYLGNVYVYVERYEDAIRQADKLLEIDPHMRIGLELKAWSIGLKGDWNRALEIFEEVHRLTNHPLKGLMGVGVAAANLGMNEKAMDCINKIEQRQREEPDAVLDGDLVGIWFALGNLDKVFYHIEQCIIKRASPINFFLEYPTFKSIKNDPRLVELKKKYATV
jgi:TolB-like protein/class 3 adenylate cyclase/Tfp pilus assembly protein PilF